MKKRIILAAAVIGIALFRAGTLFAQGCPMCKDAAKAGGEKFTNGLDASILSLFFLPFAIGGVIASMVFKSWWERSHPESALSLPQALAAAFRERRVGK